MVYGAPGEKGYIFVHGQNGYKEEAEAFAKNAVPAGYQVLSIDLPEHGERKYGEEKICAVDSGAGAANGDKTLSKQMEANQFAGEQHWRILFNAGDGKGAFGKGVVCFADCGYGTADFDDDALGQCNGSATARKRRDFNRFREDAFLAISLLGKRTCAAKLADSDGGSLRGAGYDDGHCDDRDICQKTCSKADGI